MVATRFAVAVHMMMLLAGAGRGRAFGPGLPPGGNLPATSGRLATILNTNPVVIRRIAGQLSRAGLIRVHRGPGGAELTRSADGITLADIFEAVHAAGRRSLLPLHAPAAAGTGGGPQTSPGWAQEALREVFWEAETSFRDALARVTLGDVVRRATRAEAELEPARD